MDEAASETIDNWCRGDYKADLSEVYGRSAIVVSLLTIVLFQMLPSHVRHFIENYSYKPGTDALSINNVLISNRKYFF